MALRHLFWRTSGKIALDHLPMDTLRNASVKLTAAAEVRNEKHYFESLSVMKKLMPKTPDDSDKIWMTGRLILGAAKVEDHETVESTLPSLKYLLGLLKMNKDAPRAWGLGYLAAVNSTEYDSHLEMTLRAADGIKEIPDALWAHVVNLQAAARAGDNQTFDHILTQMKFITRKFSVAEALTDIPADDWRAWAMSMVGKSAVMLGKTDIHQELNHPLTRAIARANPQNATLAKIWATTTADLLHEKEVVATARIESNQVKASLTRA